MGPKSRSKAKAPVEEKHEEPAMDPVDSMEIVQDEKKSHTATVKRIPTVKDIVSDPLTQTASKLWSADVEADIDLYKESVVKELYHNELLSGNTAKYQILEFSGYLENYLWRYYSKDVCIEHTLSIIMLVNEKSKAGLSAFESLTNDSEKFSVLCQRVVDMLLNGELQESFHEPYTLFFVNIFRNIEDVVTRQNALRYLSLPIWEALSKTRLTREFDNNAQLQKHWQKLQSQKAAFSAQKEKATSSRTTPQKTPKGKSKKRKAEEAVVDAPESVTANSAESDVSAQFVRDSQWMPKFLELFMNTCKKQTADEIVPTQTLKFLERFVELLIDLQSQLPTRRFLRTLLCDMHFVAVCRALPLLSRPECKLLGKLVGVLDGYVHFEVDDQTGRARTAHVMLESANSRIHALQQVAYSDFGDDLRDLVFSSVGELSKRELLLRHLELLDDDKLLELARKIFVLTDKDVESGDALMRDADFVRELLCEELVARDNHLEELNMLSLFPTEALLWDENQLPLSNSYTGDQVLSLPKLNLQFLTIHDYLLRNFTLFRLESAYEIRDDLTDAIKRMGPKEGHGGKVTFHGWARMALPISSISIDEVSKPRLGELVPKHVDCSVMIDISRFSGDIKAEWEAMREHDVVFLVCIERPQPEALARLAEFEKEQKQQQMSSKAGKTKVKRDFQWAEEELSFMKLFGVKHVRGGAVFEMRDEADVVLNDPTRPDDRQFGRTGNKRKLRMHLDSAQYYTDMKSGSDCYESLNLLVRRKPKENNFKAILETIRDLINTAALGRAIPNWLHDVFLGYGNPAAANYRTLNTTGCEVTNYTDTFTDARHLAESFPAARDIVLNNESGAEFVVKRDGVLVAEQDWTALPPPPYTVTIRKQKQIVGATTSPAAKSSGKASKKSKTAAAASATVAAVAQSSASGSQLCESVTARHYSQPNQGPYAEDQPPVNVVRFTPTQVEAIRSGANPGLTLIVGPPGTGKTDVAVQIIANLYHNFPTQKILIVTHSNAALNDLFEKIMQRNIAPRHLLRLGAGEAELRESLALAGAKGGGQGQGEAFNKQGRVNWTLMRRMQLLSQVQFLAQSLGATGDMGYTCETAEFFQLEFVKPRIDKFRSDAAARARDASSTTTVRDIFPFNNYFTETPKPLFTDSSWEADLKAAEGCFLHLNKMFQELADYRAFELLRTQGLRSDFLLTKQARIVAMTCTHAAMTRNRLVQLGFKYDSVVMEEAAQILEVETLIPMLLQDSDPVDGSRLKRVVLLGDHHQLPPVVKHLAFQKFAKLDQSLFTRFVRLGVPTVQLDRQGRSREEIAALYSWRYNAPGKSLGNLDMVREALVFQLANAGFAHTMQLVNVPAFQGRGETCPTPFFYQNLGEAEYVVAVFQYMRLLGYPAEKISIITSYNGQKHLIRDIIAQRCQNAVFGRPAHITTVDKFQGQQNDYVLLSLVRTETVGHLRDVRRLVVALSRARLGLYVFCRQALYENCFELSPAFQQLLSRPSTLQLVAGEGYPTARVANAELPASSVHGVADVTAMGVLVYQMVQQAQSQVNSA